MGNSFSARSTSSTLLIPSRWIVAVCSRNKNGYWMPALCQTLSYFTALWYQIFTRFLYVMCYYDPLLCLRSPSYCVLPWPSLVQPDSKAHAVPTTLYWWYFFWHAHQRLNHLKKKIGTCPVNFTHGRELASSWLLNVCISWYSLQLQNKAMLRCAQMQLYV